MNAPSPLQEVKVRARVRRNTATCAGAGVADALPVPTLGAFLEEVAREVGFTGYPHARRVLGGDAGPGEDHGTMWHAPGCTMLLNGWFAHLEEARAAMGAASVLLPYRRQFVVAEAAYLVELGLDPTDPAWEEAGRDLVAAYGTPSWATLALRRLHATRSV